MSDKLNNIVYLNEEQFTELCNNGSITVNEQTVIYNENDLYLTPDEGVNIDTSNFVTLDGPETIEGEKTFAADLKINWGNGILFGDADYGYREPVLSIGSEDNNQEGAIGVITFKDALVFRGQYGDEGGGLRLDAEGITLSGKTYYNNGTLNLTNSAIEVNGNVGTAGQVLTSTGSGVEWKNAAGGSVDLSNYVTLDGEETLTGTKSYDVSGATMSIGQSGLSFDEAETYFNLRYDGSDIGITYRNISTTENEDISLSLPGTSGTLATQQWITNSFIDKTSSQTITGTKTFQNGSGIQVTYDGRNYVRLIGGQSSAYLNIFNYGTGSQAVTLTFPNKAGTFALLSDIPTVPTISVDDSPVSSINFYVDSNGYLNIETE